MLVYQSQKHTSTRFSILAYAVKLVVATQLKMYFTVQVKSKLLVSFRSRQVIVHVPEFVSEAEQQLLGAALKQWQTSAEGAVASSALDMQVAEQRLRHAFFRYGRTCLSFGSCCAICLTQAHALHLVQAG